MTPQLTITIELKSWINLLTAPYPSDWHEQQVGATL